MIPDPFAALAREQRLRDLASQIPGGEWTYRRSRVDDQLILWADDEPLALIYAGTDLAKYLCEVSPGKIFGL